MDGWMEEGRTKGGREGGNGEGKGRDGRIKAHPKPNQSTIASTQGQTRRLGHVSFQTNFFLNMQFGGLV